MLKQITFLENMIYSNLCERYLIFTLQALREMSFSNNLLELNVDIDYSN
jgi:hypothetical protein